MVPGEGPGQARLMLVGEQPGDSEDRAGKPFDGRLLDKALAAAEVPRSAVFVINAVKHFKFKPRGKRGLHKRPNVGEIERCSWWLGQERKLVRPSAMVAMGATALRSLLGRSVAISALRKKVQDLEDGTPLLVTIHPSYLLRIRGGGDRDREWQAFVRDLRRGWKFATTASP